MPNRYWYLLLGLTTLVALVLKGWCILGLPFPMDGDSIGFLPQIVHYRADGQLVNTLYQSAVEYSPQKDGRYIWHGILYPLLTAHLLPHADYTSWALVIFIYQIITLGAFACATAMLRPANIPAAFAMASIVLVCAAWLDIGRPESMVELWLSLGLLSFLHARNTWQIWIAGITIGLIAATSLIPAILLGLFYVSYLALEKNWLDCLKNGFLAAIVAIAIFFATFLFYPYTISEWFHGTIHHATVSVSERSFQFSSFVLGWIKSIANPLAIFWIGLFFVILVFQAARIDWRRNGWRVGFIVFVVFTIVAIARTSIDTRIYNIACLAPVFLFATQAMLWKLVEEWQGWQKKVLSALILLFALATTVPLLANSLIRFYTHQGLDREHAEALVTKIMQDEPGTIDFSSGLFTLTTYPRGAALTLSDYMDGTTIHSQADFVLIQQINPYKAAPPTFSNYTLVQNYFTNYVPKFCGLRLAQSPRVYNFAVYKRNP